MNNWSEKNRVSRQTAAVWAVIAALALAASLCFGVSAAYAQPGNAGGAGSQSVASKTNPTWERLAGEKALDTMEQITKKFGKAKVAVVAVNIDWHDTLAASGLAGSLGAPMLTTNGTTLSAQTRAELNRMGVQTVHIIGSKDAISDKVKDQILALKSVSSIVRHWGPTPSGCSLACAQAMPSKSNTAIIATPKDFKDALSISSYAYATKSPVFYTQTYGKPVTTGLATNIVDFIKNNSMKIIIVGGPKAVPESVETQLIKAGISANNITRLAGSNEYKTSRVIAEWATGKLPNGTGGGKGLYQYASVKFQPKTKLFVNKMGVSRADGASGWKDALAGAALCGKNKSVLLLCDDNAKTWDNNGAYTLAFVKQNRDKITMAYVFGGPKAVSDTVFNKLNAASRPVTNTKSMSI